MSSLVSLLFIAILAGVAVAVQAKFMGTMDRLAGTATSVLITYGLGAIIASLLWLAGGRPVEGVKQIPWYAFSAGAFGLVIVAGIGYAAPRLGLGGTLVVSVAAQLVAAMIIDRQFDLTRISGLAITIVGVWLTMQGKS